MSKVKRSGLTKGEKSRLNIVAKAAVIFNQRGFEGSSMQDIVEAAGLEKGSIYGHFSSKEELALEAFDFAWADTVQKRMGNLDTVDNAVDKLKLHVSNYVNTPSFSGGCPLLNTAIDADDGNLALRDRARKAVRGWEEALVNIVIEGQRRGEVRLEVQPHSVATFLISTLEGATAVSRIDKRSGALAHAQENLDRFLEAEVSART
jgi:TetR/AcrR family transcriptional regulator, transcriptional repressor for nem operon